MATTADLSPFRSGSVNEIRKISKSADQRNRERIAARFGQAGLLLHIVCKMRKRIALCQTAFIADFFIASSKRHRLECDKRNLLWVRSCELDDWSNLIVIDSVNERYHQDDFHS